MNTDFKSINVARMREEGSPLQGLRRLYIHVNSPNSRVAFYENWTWCVGALYDEETEEKLQEIHTERMEIVREAFPAIEGKLREAGILRFYRIAPVPNNPPDLQIPSTRAFSNQRLHMKKSNTF